MRERAWTRWTIGPWTGLAAGLAAAPWAWGNPTTGSMPWSSPLDTLRADITGPTLTAVVLIGIAIGLGKWALSDDNRGLVRTAKAIIALAAGVGGIALLGALGIDACAV